MWLTIIIYFLSILIPGWLILSLWFDDETKGWFKKMALAYGLGTALLTMEIFLIVFVLRWPIQWLWPVLALETLVLAYSYWRRFGWDLAKRFRLEAKKVTWKESLLAILVAVQIAAVACLAYLNPVINWDSVAMWSFKAKVLFYHLSGFFDSASPWFWQQQNHANYPWLVPLSQYWLAVINQGFDETAVNFIFVGFFMAVIFLFYGCLRNYLNRLVSLLLVFLLATMPLVTYHAYNAYADLPLAFYLGAAFVLNYKWLDTANHKYLILSWIFLAGALFTKSEAIIFIIAHLLILFLAKRALNVDWKKIGGSFIPALVVIAPWLAFKIFYKLPTSNVGGGIAWHGQVVGQSLEDLFVAASWNIWWYVFFGLSLLFIKQIIKDRSLRLSYALWCLAFGGLLILYLFTEEYEYAVNGTAFSRNLINFVPGSVWLLGLLLRREFLSRYKFFSS